jgi:broad specificity phosphatase PhoE
MLLQGFVPTLDGEVLTQGPDGYLHADGTLVERGRAQDIIWLNPSELQGLTPLTPTGRWRAAREGGALTPDEPEEERFVFSPSDLENLLLTVAAAHSPEVPIEVDAGFFHRTLVRWMGLDEDDDEASPASRAPLWDYGFWKAEIQEEDPFDASALPVPAGAKASAWSAIVWRGEGAAPERFRYWVAFDEGGRITASRWLTPPPDLLGDPKPGGAFTQTALDPDLVDRLLSDPDA